MEIKSDEKVKASALLLAIVLTLVLLFSKMAARNREQQNTPALSPVPKVQQPPVALRNVQGNPFWTQYALQSQVQAERLAHPPAGASVPGNSIAMAPAVVVQPQTPDLCLMGIITDGTRMAVIKVGEDMRCLPEGALVDAVTRIQSILPGRVTLQESGKQRTILLGQQVVRAQSREMKQTAVLTAEPVPPTLPGFAEPGQLRPETKVNAGF